ncbi:MAG: NADH-quinone oxidoreductase subunit N [Muribaculaceae bacterium]|nr:NADH-quinone oxidoreductase subunit N [Muribaculaceae bacterium]
MDYSQFLLMPQEIGLLLVFLLVFIYDTFMPERSQRYMPIFTVIMMALYTIYCFCFPAATGEAFGGMFESNAPTWVMKNILNVGVLLVLLQAVKWTNSDFVSVRRGEFYELTLLTLLGMFLMISARHFLLFVIGLETASLPIAALAAFEKRHYESHEAAAKYIFTAIFSSAIFLLGISFVYGMSGTLYFKEIATALIGNRSALLIAALAFVIAGVGFKLSLVPFHQWTADVYQGAPTAVTSYLSVISKGAAAFSFLIILVQVFGSAYGQVWEWMLYAVIVLTITLGNLFAVRQRNLKRFLAFSSISQAGYIMLGIIAVNVMGMSSMIYYVLVYIFSNLAAFGVIAAIERQTGKVTMDDYNGLFKTNPWLAFTMMLAMFSLGGIPPFAGFFSKFFIFVGACQQGSIAIYILVLIALVNTIISLYYYLLVVKAMFLRQDDCVIPTIKSHWTERLGLILCVAGIIFIGLISCIYAYINGAVDAISSMFAAIQ